MKDDTVYLRYIFEMIRRIEENTHQGSVSISSASGTLFRTMCRNSRPPSWRCSKAPPSPDYS
jgi:hypothetical protein